MHKFFAKTSFLGKKIIYLPECHSTNEQLLHLSKKEHLPEGTIVATGNQTMGKGQRGNSWESEPGKNLLFSILIRPSFLSFKNHFFLYIISALSGFECLKTYLPMPEFIKIKWPNDLMVGKKKASGILIENNIKGNGIEHAVIGVGLNVNQHQNLPASATSIFLETSQYLALEAVLESFIIQLEKWYLKLRSGEYEEIKKIYEEKLFWIGEERRFSDQKSTFYGKIQGISDQGKLKIQTPKGLITYDLKEIRFLL